jgi:transposase
VHFDLKCYHCCFDVALILSSSLVSLGVGIFLAHPLHTKMGRPMQGKHSFDPRAETVISLESFVPQDHFLRQVDRALDLSFVHELTAPYYADRLGRPSIDPEVYFRMQLVAYLYGIHSERRLCEDIYCNLAYRWFCRLSPQDDVPDHSSFTYIRDRYGEEIFETVFCRIVALCKAKGLVHEECRVMTDATLIAADAATMSMVPKEPAPTEQDKQSPPGSGGPPRTSGQLKVSNQTHHSRTDPDASLARKDRTPLQLKYKVHQTIDAETRIILDTHVTTGAVHDSQPYLKQLQRVGERHGVHIREATADRGYGSAAIIRYLQQRGIETYIPLWSGRSGSSKYLKGELVYEKEYDRFRCPQGKFLTPNPAISENQKRYVSSSEDCRHCPQAATCPARTRGPSPQRFVLRNLDQDLFEEVQAKMRDPTFRRKRSERMWKSEGLFAEAKRNHCLARAKYRGLCKVQIQAYFSAIVQNLKRLIALIYYRLVACWLRKQTRST